jgi:hypothetical protein
MQRGIAMRYGQDAIKAPADAITRRHQSYSRIDGRVQAAARRVPPGLTIGCRSG